MASSKNSALVVQSKVKGVIKKAKMKCSSDVVDALNKMVDSILIKGCARAKANGRKTLRGADL